MAFLVFDQQPSSINPENFARVKPGMTEKEVVAILGAPGTRNAGQLDWDGPQWVATIYFDNEGMVTVTMFGPNEHSLFRKIRHWFPR